MKKLLFTGVAVSALAFATPAFAQEEEATVGGAFVGVIVGYDEVKLDDGTTSGSEGDVAYGVTAGYDFALGSTAFVGVEVEAAESEVGVTATDVLVVGDSLSMAAGRDLYVGARVGFEVSGNTRLYAKGGYSNARVSVVYDDGVTVLSDGDNLDGFRLGAGGEVDVGAVTVRGEYRYSSYGEVLNSGVDISRHQFMIGLLGRF